MNPYVDTFFYPNSISGAKLRIYFDTAKIFLHKFSDKHFIRLFYSKIFFAHNNSRTTVSAPKGKLLPSKGKASPPYPSQTAASIMFPSWAEKVSMLG